MKKHGPKRKLETAFLYCNKHGECDHVETGIKIKKWKCCACTVEYSANYRIRRKKKAIEFLGGKCQFCGYNGFYGSLVFHHKNPLFKSYDLSGTALSKSWETLVKELKKCQLLCMNCHYELHNKIDKEAKEARKLTKTNYHKKQIHEINSRKLGKKISP